MKDFDYIIIGGGCAGLSLAYELDIHKKLENKTLAIIEPRDEYKRDKTWSFWKIVPHNFDDCVKKSWSNFSINIPNKTQHLECKSYPYQSIDSGLFYEKINKKLKENKNISFYKDINEINSENSFIFNSVPKLDTNKGSGLWQHFCGVEIETKKKFFDDEIMNLMDFDCEQKESVHFFYTLPYSKNKALVETTWISMMHDKSEKDYDSQIKNYVENHLNLKDYKITYKEEGAIPLFYPSNERGKNKINIGTAGNMTRLSTGYTFLNIQEQSKLIRENIESINKMEKDRQDLVTAIIKLKESITELNQKGRERLLEAFEKVNRKFNEVYTKLFNGGNAKLELVDSDDPLDAGLEMLVSPPGKRLQSITLLSGGEQALTALSLIFAVFLTNPSPICVLDEVDAPLDDANVTRFCGLLNELTKITTTRFIIVTHHALTMSKMDRLYGGTMPEKGISQLVAVDLQKAESMVA